MPEPRALIPETAPKVWRWPRGTGTASAVDAVAAEEPVELRVDSRSVAVLMRTPGHDEELAAGFLLSEGLIHSKDDLAGLRRLARNPAGNIVEAFTAPSVVVDFARLTRHVFAASSCGLCGKTTIDAVQRTFPALRARFRVPSEIVLSLPGRMRAAQSGFSATGGLHAAALFTADGELLVVREDVGRHNAVDKVLGRSLLDGALPLSRHLLLVSGRASFEIAQKALAGGIAFVAAVSAPSSLAVALARRSGQTLVGFLRDGRFNVYSRPGRVGRGAFR